MGDFEVLRERVEAYLAASEQAHLGHLGSEYVSALESAANLRAMAEANPFSELKSGRVVVNPLFAEADRDVRRALSVAKAIGFNQSLEVRVEDRFAELDAVPSLAARRRNRGA
jgi:hypothetical protein